MSQVEDFVKEVEELRADDGNILIITGKPGSGKSGVLREAAAKKAWNYVDCRLLITEEFLELLPALRQEKAPEMIGEILAGYSSDIVLLDRLQTLFVPVFHIDIADLLRKLGKKFVIAAAWPGYYENGCLCYDKFDGTESIKISAEGFKIWDVD